MALHQLDQLQMGERIRKRRETLGYSREQLAALLDVSAKFLADIECGNKGISLKKFASLIQLLDVSADYLLFGDSSEPHKLICEVKYFFD